MTVDVKSAREVRPKVKRVYKTVSVGEEGGQFRVLLDGKPVRTPMRKFVETPRRGLAEAVAAEWDAQDPHIEPEKMPLTRLVSTALDRVAPERAALIDELMKYADADLLCYRVDAPAGLKARQDAVWQPVLDWLSAQLGVSMGTVAGLMPLRQSSQTVTRLREALEALDVEKLTVLQATAAIANSLALSLALVHARLTAADVYAATMLDETFQMEQWGADDLAVERQRIIEADLSAIGEYLRLVK